MPLKKQREQLVELSGQKAFLSFRRQVRANRRKKQSRPKN
jgi:hypothetical protein